MKSFNTLLVLAFILPVLVALTYANVSAMEMKDSMMNKLINTNVPVTIPLTKGYVKGSEVFYISTEASDKDLADQLTKLTGFRVAYTPALQKTPADALAQIYAFKNGIKGPGPLGFQPNVSDSQPGDANYSPIWAINIVEWKDGIVPRELKSQTEILDAQANNELTVTASGLIVNCPFVQWNGGNLKIRDDKTLTDLTPYGGGQVLDIDTENLQVTFVAHRGFGPDGSTIYYIATDASKQDVADMLGVLFVEKTGATLLSGASSDFLTTPSGITTAGSKGALITEVAGVVVNCPFVEVDEKFMMEDKMMEEKESTMMEKEDTMMKMENMDSPLKQMKSGVAASDVICKEGLELIFKVADGSANCVSSNTASQLVAKGWATQ